ncbi:MAG TPA: anti-sigma factor domain-containing protein [Bacillales bacterium]
MKHGIVMEVKRRKAVVLTENGRFETIRLPKGMTAEIGEKVAVPAEGAGVNVNRDRKSKRWLPAISTVAVIFIFLVLLGGVYPSHPDETIAAYVSYDVNPSFSAAVNGNMQVVSVKTWNQDASRLFGEWDSYRFMKLKTFSRHVIERFAESGYLGGEPHVLIATAVVAQNHDKRRQITNSLKDTINSIRSGALLAKNDVAVTVRNSDAQTRKEAKAHGLSLGKYLLYLDASDSGKNLSIHTIKQSSVAEIERKLESKSEPVSETETAAEPDKQHQNKEKPVDSEELDSDSKQLNSLKSNDSQKIKQPPENHDKGKHKGWYKEKSHHHKKKKKDKDKAGPKPKPNPSGKRDHAKSEHTGQKEKKHPSHHPVSKKPPGKKHNNKDNKHENHGKKDKPKKKQTQAHHNNKPPHPGPKNHQNGNNRRLELKLEMLLPRAANQKKVIEKDIGSLHIVIKFDKKTE